MLEVNYKRLSGIWQPWYPPHLLRRPGAGPGGSVEKISRADRVRKVRSAGLVGL